MHGSVRHAGEAYIKKVDFHKDISTALNRMWGSTRGIPEGEWWLGTNTIDNNNEIIINNYFTNILEYIEYTNNNCKNCRGNPPNNNPKYGISDTGDTQNYIKVDTPCRNRIKTSQGTRVILPDGRIMQATYKAILKISPLLLTRANIAHISPHIQSGAQISIGQVCDDGCTSTFVDTTMIAYKQVEKVLEGKRNEEAGMWQVKITPPQFPTPTHQSANTLMPDRTKPELEQWYHVTLFGHAKKTLIQAIKKGCFGTWP